MNDEIPKFYLWEKGRPETKVVGRFPYVEVIDLSGKVLRVVARDEEAVFYRKESPWWRFWKPRLYWIYHSSHEGGMPHLDNNNKLVI